MAEVPPAMSLRDVPASAFTEQPLCKCHGVSMRWQKMARLRQGGHWKCKANDPVRYRNIRLKKFGITEEEYEALLKRQNGVCAICKGPPDTRWKRLAVDHDHVTREVRGLLCMVCNTMLGRLERRWGEVMEYLKCAST